MKPRRSSLKSASKVHPIIVVASLLLVSASSAGADDLLGFYVGGAIGQSRIVASSSYPTATVPYRVDIDEGHFAYKVMAGVRPISWLGAEISYMDFGTVEQTGYALPQDVSAIKASMKAESAFGVLYLPIPVIDVYGKAGAARMETHATGHYNNGSTSDICIVNGLCGFVSPFNLDETTIGFAEGGGAQYKFGSGAMRAEYERFSAAGQHPYLLSLGLSWQF